MVGALRCEPVVVMDPAEDGQGDERALGGWRGPEFRVRRRDRVNRLRWPRAVVVGHVGVHDPPELRDAEKDEVVEGFLPQGPHEPFDVG